MAPLKVQCHKIFCFWFFSWISFPSAPEYSIRTVSNFFKNSQKYSQVKVYHRYQWHQSQICHWCQRPVSMIPVQICHLYQRHRWQIFPPVSLVLLIPVANLPPVSTTPVANNENNYRTADNSKWIRRKNFIYMLTLLPKDVQKKLWKFFWLKIFSICHRCQRHRWCTLSCEYISENFAKKFKMAQMVWSGSSRNWSM